MRAVLTTLVSRIGFRDVVSAANGDQALEKMHDQKFDLVLCDYHMSPCDGFELKRRLDADEVYADMAFVMVTADTDLAVITRAATSGVDLLIKPFKADALLSTLKRNLGAARMRQVLA